MKVLCYILPVVAAVLLLAGCPTGNQSVVSLTISPLSIRLNVGQSSTLTATSSAASDTFTWVSADSSVVTVTQSGRISAIAPGTARVSVTSEITGRVASASVTVPEVATGDQSLSVTPAAASIVIGDSVQLTGVVMAESAVVGWSSEDAGIAAVDATGLVTGIAVGTVNIVAQVEGSTETAVAVITVVEPGIPVAVVRPPGVGLIVGETLTLTADSADPEEDFAWTSQDDTVATVDATGTVTAVGVGVVRVTTTGVSSGAVGHAMIAVEEPEFVQVSVSPVAAVVAVGDTVTLVGSTTRPGDTLRWISADEAIATVDESGVVTGVGAGTISVTAFGTNADERSSALVTVVDPVPPVAIIRPSGASIAVGETLALRAQSDDPTEEFDWSSGDGALATVDSAGVVSGVAAGTVQITAMGTRTGALGSASITITETVVHEVVVAPEAATITVGDSVQLSASTTRSGDTLTWVSGDEAVATVDAAGLVTGVSAGTITITAAGIGPGESAESVITVVAAVPKLVTVRPLASNVTVGETVTLSATSTDSADSFVWSSGSTAVATVDAAGVVSGVSPGTSVITVEGTNSGETDQATVTVTAAVVHRVEVTPASAMIFVGDTFQLSGSTSRPGGVLTWSSGDTSVATVNGTGLVTGVSAGTAMIAAQGLLPESRAVALITVMNVPVPVATIRPLGASISVGSSVTLTATSGNSSDTFGWTSANTSIATVSASGVVTGVSAGTVRIDVTGSVSGATGSSTITVTEAVVHRVTVSPTSATVFLGDTFQLAGTTTRLGDTLTWSSGASSIATVNQSGLVSGVAVGTATVTAQGANPDERGSSVITVLAPEVPVATVRPLAASIVAGSTVSLTATSGGSTDGFTWRSANTSIATVSGLGVVTGVTPGEVRITAIKTSNGATGNATITVTAPPVDLITVIPMSATVAVSNDVVVQAVSTNGGDSFTWMSEDVSVATVNANGVVTGVGVGTVDVVVTGTVSGAQARVAISVIEVTVHEVTVAPVEATIFVADTVQLTATSTDTEDSFDWESADDTIATISGTGVIAGVGAGSVVVTAQGTHSGVRASATVTVVAHTVTIDPVSVVVLAGTTTQLTAMSTDEDDSFTWSSNAQALATVSGSGLVTGLTGGTVMVTATGTSSGVSATAEVTVRNGVAVNPPLGTITEGATLLLTAQSTNVGESITWSTSNAGIATVDAMGLVRGVQAGNVTITATGDASSESATSAITVVPVLSLSPSVASVAKGRIVQLLARIRDIEDTLSWSSADPSIATVNATGVVTGVSVGTVQVRVTGSHSGGIGVATVQVLPAFPNALLFDGETDFASSQRSQRNLVEQFRGVGCLEGIPDPFAGFFRTFRGEFYRSDLSSFDEIWLVVKAIGSNAHSTFSLRGFQQGSSKKVELTSYMQGGTIDSTYKLARVPMADLLSDTFDATSVEAVEFGPLLPSESFRLFIDDVWAVDLSGLDEFGGPLVGALPAYKFGNGSVSTGVQVALGIRNLGGSPLRVTGARILGPNGTAFSISPASFTVPPGESFPVDLNFLPAAAGDFTATLVLPHNTTAFGQETRVPLSGRGVAPGLKLSVERVDFGAIPVLGTIVRRLSFTNVGNEVLTVSGLSASNSIFALNSGGFSLEPGASRMVEISALPTTVGTSDGVLSFTTNDPNRETVALPLALEALTASSQGVLPVDVLGTTSSSVELSWGVLSVADAVRVTIGPEPSSAANGPLPLEHEVALLPGDASGITISDLAPGVHVFVRVVASLAGVPLAERNVAAITPGGPEAVLDSKLREVHLFAPNIIQVLLTDLRIHTFRSDANNFDQGIDEIIGNTGASWQAGPWTVERSDGAQIPVTNVYRHSVPARARYYDLGYRRSTNDHLVDMEHMIYLELAEDVGSPEVLRVVGPTFTYEIIQPDLTRVNRTTSLDMTLPFSDRYLVTPAIQVNQVGYSPAATRRYAYVSGWMGDGGGLPLDRYPLMAEVIEETEELSTPRPTVLANLPIALRAELDGDAGAEVRDIDIAALPESDEAVYHIRVPGVGVSWPTRVSELAVFEAYYHVARGMFHNRWAGDLAPEYTDWSRPVDHGTVFTAEGLEPFVMFPFNTPQVGERPLLGGHHDAGDFDIRAYHTIVAPMLMRAFEMNQSAFTDGQLVIPESGNGIPDLLDEALWSVAGWEYLQDEDGGVRIGAESSSHPPGIYFAHEDELVYWTYSKLPVFAARSAGVFAQAARLVAPYDAIRASMLRTRAEAAYDYALANGVDESAGGPIFYAAGELFRLTGEDEYRDMFESAWVENGSPFQPFAPPIFEREILGPGSYTAAVAPVQWEHMLGYLGSEGALEEYKFIMTRILNRRPDSLMELMDRFHAHRNVRGTNAALTFGKGTAVGQYLDGAYASIQNGGLDDAALQTNFDLMSLSADYMLGCNPAGISWITGLGARKPLDALYLDSLAFVHGGRDSIPGIPLYGPADNIPTNSFYTYATRLAEPAFRDSPRARRYADVHYIVVCNEFTVWETQAPTVQLFASMIAPGMMPPEDWLPEAVRMNGSGMKR